MRVALPLDLLGSGADLNVPGAADHVSLGCWVVDGVEAAPAAVRGVNHPGDENIPRARSTRVRLCSRSILASWPDSIVCCSWACKRLSICR